MDKNVKDELDKLKKHKPVEFVKLATKFAVRRSVSGIMVTLVHNYVPTETKAQKAQLYVGAWALGGVVSDSASAWASEKVGDFYESTEKLLKNVKIDWNKTVKDEPTAE